MSLKHDSTGKNYRSRNENDHDDYFPTYHVLTRLYLDKVSFNEDYTFLDPCAGNSDITKVLKEYNFNNVFEFDIKPRNKNIQKKDYLKVDDGVKYDNIITNPPFKLANEFIEKSTKKANETISMLLPLDYLHGIARYELMYKKGCNGFFLDTVFPFIRRPLFGSQYDPSGLMPTGATSFAWFLFTKCNKLDPVIRWLDNIAFMGTPQHIDQIRMEL